VRDQEPKGRPRRRAFHKDSVEYVSLVGKVPNVRGSFRPEIEFRRRVGCVIDGIPGDSATEDKERSVDSESVSDDDGFRTGLATHATTTPTNMTTCTAG